MGNQQRIIIITFLFLAAAFATKAQATKSIKRNSKEQENKSAIKDSSNTSQGYYGATAYFADNVHPIQYQRFYASNLTEIKKMADSVSKGRQIVFDDVEFVTGGKRVTLNVSNYKDSL